MPRAHAVTDRRERVRLALRRARLRLVRWLTYTRRLYRLVLAVRPQRRRRLPTRRTELMIDGFPRSANTFSMCAFQVANGPEVPLSHHLHAPGQIRWAVDHGVPVLLLVREPDEVVLSEGSHRDRNWDLSEVLRWYVRFHRELAPVHGRIEVADFDEVTTDFGAVIDRLNARYGTDFRRYENDPQRDAEVFSILDAGIRRRRGGRLASESAPRPSAARDAIKARLRQTRDDPDLAHLWAEARTVYRHWSPVAGRHG